MTKEDIEKKVIQVLVTELSCNESEVVPDATIREDLGADSLDFVEVSMALEEEFDIGEISDDDVPNLKTVSDVNTYIAAKLNVTA